MLDQSMLLCFGLSWLLLCRWWMMRGIYLVKDSFFHQICSCKVSYFLCCFQMIEEFFLLWELIILSILVVQLYDTLMVCRLKYFLRSDFPKCLSIRLKNFLATFVFTFWLKGGLNHKIFLHLVLFIFGCFTSFMNSIFSSLYPAFFNESWYIWASLIKISLDEERLDILLAIMVGSCFLMTCGWFESICM